MPDWFVILASKLQKNSDYHQVHNIEVHNAKTLEEQEPDYSDKFAINRVGTSSITLDNETPKMGMSIGIAYCRTAGRM